MNGLDLFVQLHLYAVIKLTHKFHENNGFQKKKA